MPKTIEDKFEDLKKTILGTLKDELEKVDEFPHDFNSDGMHDTVHTEVDSWACGIDRNEAMEFIDYCDNESYIESELINHSTLEKTLVTMAFECVRMKLFDDDLFQELQEYELTEEKRDNFVSQIEEIVGKHKPERIDSDSQIWVKLKFDLERDMFPLEGFPESQVLDMHDGFKVFANNKEVNRNAIVIEKPSAPGELSRIYLMQKDKDIDIREFFNRRPLSIAENDYSLRMSDYIDGIKREEFDNPEEFVWYINQMANELLKRE